MKKIIRSYILKGAEVFVGLEDSKKKWVLCVRSGGVIVNETTMPAKYEVLRNYFHNKFPECKICLMYEAGFRGFGLHDQIVSDGWKCVVTPPHLVTEEKCQRKKNDRIDSRRLAKNLENNDYRSCNVPDKELREDRQLTRSYGQIQTDLARVRNRIRRALEFHGLDPYFPAGRWYSRDYKELNAKLEELNLSSSLRFAFDILIMEMEQLRQLKKNLLVELRKLGKSGRYKKTVDILKSAPGIGMLTAIRLALEWGDVSRFKRKECFASFTGLTPSEYSTGEQERKGHITKQGNRAVRGWLIESAWVAIRHDGILYEKFYTVWKSTGSKKKAIVAVARKLAIRLRAILLNNELYQVGIVQ